MKKTFLTLVMMLMCIVASAQTFVYSVARDGYTNIRTSNSTNSRIIGEMTNGGAYAVLLHTSGNWYKVNYQGIIGYVNKTQVKLTGNKSSQTSVSHTIISIAKDGYTNIRKGPGTNYDIVGEIINGSGSAKYISTSGNWYKVNYRGIVGYVHKSQVKMK